MKTTHTPPEQQSSHLESNSHALHQSQPQLPTHDPRYILDLQRTHGNRAVQRHLATLQRLKDTRRPTSSANPSGKVDIGTLTLSEVNEYLEYAKALRRKKPIPPEVTFDNLDGDEMQLTRRKRELEMQASTSQLESLRVRVQNLQKDLMKRHGEIDTLASSLRHNPTLMSALIQQLRHFERTLKEAEVLEPPMGGSAKISREENIERHLKQLISHLIETIDIPIREVQDLGLPHLDSATIREWSLLEGEKDRARKIREPIDSLLMSFAPRISALIPKATLNYRGSLARGIKSPKKYEGTPAGPKLASFDRPFTEVDTVRGTTTSSRASYDIDLNIEAPGETLGDLGLQNGPLDKTDASNATRQKLEGLLVELKVALGSLGIAELDVGGCKFFISSRGKAIGQLDQGTPYTPGLLANAGMPTLATSLPQAYSPELINKVREYADATQVRVINGQKYYYPLNHWDPLIRQMFNHILANGPLATFMPDVQVEVSAKSTREFTGVPRPERTGGLPTAQRGPFNPLTQHGGTYVGVLQQCPHVGAFQVGAIFVGQVVQQMKNGKSVLVDVGSGITCFLPGPFLAMGYWGIFEVTQPAAMGKNATVKHHGKY